MIALAATLWPAAALAAAAAYVTYMATFGDWSVLCAYDEPTRRHWCTLQAPPPTLFDGRSEIVVGEEADGVYWVVVRVRGGVVPGSPVYLRVDANPPHGAYPNRVGEAVWRGVAAADLVDEMRLGRHLVVRSFAAAGTAPRDEHLALDGFAEALAESRVRRRERGAFGGR